MRWLVLIILPSAFGNAVWMPFVTEVYWHYTKCVLLIRRGWKTSLSLQTHDIVESSRSSEDLLSALFRMLQCLHTSLPLYCNIYSDQASRTSLKENSPGL